MPRPESSDLCDGSSNTGTAGGACEAFRAKTAFPPVVLPRMESDVRKKPTERFRGLSKYVISI